MFMNIASVGMGVVSARRGGDWPVRVLKKQLGGSDCLTVLGRNSR